MSVYHDANRRVKPEHEKNAHVNDGPARPQVEYPRCFTKVPIKRLNAMVLDPSRQLQHEDIQTLITLADHAHRLASGEHGLAMPSHEELGDEVGKKRHAMMRSVARIVADGLIFPFHARMAKGRKDGGQWAKNYYDLAPYYQLCGEDVHPRTLAQVEKYLDESGLWRRGMKLERGLKSSKTHEANTQEVDGVAPVQHGEEGGYPQGGTSTVSHGCDSNNNPSSDFVLKDNVQPGPKARRGVDALPADQQVVYCRLMELSYGHFKAIHDLKKYGAPYVEARIDFVTRDATNVVSAPCLINHWLKRPLSEAYKPVQPKAVPKPQAAPRRPATTAAPKKAAGGPEMATAAPQSKAERLAALRTEVQTYSAGDIHQAKLAMLACPDERALLPVPSIAVADMKWIALTPLVVHLRRLAREGMDDAEDIFVDN